MQQSVNRIGRCYRAYLKLTSCKGRELYIPSHPDVNTPDPTSTAGIVEISSNSQGVDFENSRTTVGDLTFRIVDFDLSLIHI